MSYYGVIRCPKKITIKHSAKGEEWKQHKYIKKENGRYIYPENNVGTKYSVYRKEDTDFDEKNYDEKNRLGDTDFYGFTKPDGTTVILNEDDKWVLPKGIQLNDEIIKNLEKVTQMMENDKNANLQELMQYAVGGGPKQDIDSLAKDVMSGKYGNGEQRKQMLGANYKEVQDKVNAMMKKKK